MFTEMMAKIETGQAELRQEMRVNGNRLAAVHGEQQTMVENLANVWREMVVGQVRTIEGIRATHRTPRKSTKEGEIRSKRNSHRSVQEQRKEIAAVGTEI